MTTIRQLEAFIAVIEHGSVRAAADHLGISQPSVSKHIRSLESKLGQELFVRSRGTKARLSAMGEQLQRDARDALAAQKRFSREAARSPFPQEIRVLVRHYLFTNLEQWIEDVRLMDSGTALRFDIVGNETSIADIVAREKNSAGLMRTTSAMLQEAVLSEVMAIDACSLYASPACVENYGIIEKLPTNLPVLLPRVWPLTDWALHHLEAGGLSDANVTFTTPFMAALRRQVLDGQGAGIFMDRHVAESVTKGELVRLNMSIGPLYLQFIRNSEMDEQLAAMLRSKIRNDILRYA
jgi:DNA-binding transcriptional LysR family regulator